MKSLLVPVDFSETSLGAFRLAVEVGARYQAVVKVLHVQGVPMTDPYAEVATAEVDAMLEEKLHERLRQVIEQYRRESEESAKRCDQVEFRTVVRTGFAAGEINRFAREEEADWIVMGTRGAGGMAGALFGSVTAAVVGRADRPVLTVPNGLQPDHFSHIVCAIDSPMDSQGRLALLNEFARRFNANLTFVHVVEERDVETTGVTAATISAFQHVPGHVQATAKALTGHDVEETLVEYCQDHAVNLLVMVRERHPFLQKLIHRSMTRRLALQASVPLLIFPPE